MYMVTYLLHRILPLYMKIHHSTMGCFLVNLLRNSEMLPNYSGGIPIMKTKPNKKKIIEESEKKVFPLMGFEPTPLRVKESELTP